MDPGTLHARMGTFLLGYAGVQVARDELRRDFLTHVGGPAALGWHPRHADARFDAIFPPLFWHDFGLRLEWRKRYDLPYLILHVPPRDQLQDAELLDMIDIESSSDSISSSSSTRD